MPPRVLFFGVVMFLNKETMDVPAATPFPPWQLKLFYVNPLLVTVNSATNVLIYASLSRQSHVKEICKTALQKCSGGKFFNFPHHYVND